MDTKIIIVRHGQSVGNAQERYLGHTDLPLTDFGREQAECTANALKNEKIDIIYSSDLKRAHETAMPHAKLHGLPVNLSRNLREMFIGDFENIDLKILKRDHVDDFVIPWYQHFGTYKFPGGDSVLGASGRVHDEIIRIAKENEGKTILIVSHAAVIRGLWCRISGLTPEEYAEGFPFPTNASYSRLYFNGEKLIPDEYSIDSHMNTITQSE